MENRQFDYVNHYYGVNATMGRRVTCYGKPGTITGSRNAYIVVTLDDGAEGCYHPRDGIVYHDEIVKKPPIPARRWRSKLRWRKWVEVAECYPDLTFKDFLTLPGFKQDRG